MWRKLNLSFSEKTGVEKCPRDDDINDDDDDNDNVDGDHDDDGGGGDDDDVGEAPPSLRVETKLDNFHEFASKQFCHPWEMGSTQTTPYFSYCSPSLSLSPSLSRSLSRSRSLSLSLSQTDAVSWLTKSERDRERPLLTHVFHG